MKFRLIISCLLVLLICAGCATGTTDEVAGFESEVEAASNLTDEEKEMLGITDEGPLTEEEKAEMQTILDELKGNLDPSEAKPATGNNAAENKESADIDPEADVQKYLAKLPALPSGDPEYGYEWSDRLERISDYTVTIDPADANEVNDFLYKMESEAGYMSDGKEEWDPETDTSTYGYSTDTSRVDVVVTPNPDGTVKVVIYISYNPYA